MNQKSEAKPPPKQSNQRNPFVLLQEARKQLIKSSNDQAKFLSVLQTLSPQIATLEVSNYSQLQTLLYDIIKPITRQITNFDPHLLATLESMKLEIFKIIQLYLSMFNKFQHIGILELIKELLMRDTLFFSTVAGQASVAAAAGTSSGKVPKATTKLLFIQDHETKKDQKAFKYAKGRLGYTKFHKECCEEIFCQVETSPEMFVQMKLSTIKQLMRFMYLLQDYILDEEMHKFAIKSFESLSKIVASPSKQNIKEATKEILEDISEMLLRILHYYQDKELKEQIALLGPTFAISITQADYSIETKLAGRKILQKFANHYFYRSHDSSKGDQWFGQWLIKHKQWELLINQNVDFALISSSEYILKLIINKGKVSHQKFVNFLTLIWEVKEGIRRHYLKNIDAMRLPFSYINMTLENFSQIKADPQVYIDEFFYLIESLARYGYYNQCKNCIDIMMNLFKKHYYQWNYAIQRKSLNCFKYCFEKLIEATKDFAERVQMYVEVINQFISNPQQMTLSFSKAIFESEERKSSYTIEKAAKKLVEDCKIIQVIIDLMSQEVSYQAQLIYFLKAIVIKYKNYNVSGSLNFSDKVMLHAANYPQVFQQLIEFISPQDGDRLMKTLLQTVQQKEFAFECLKSLFYKCNHINIDEIPSEYFKRKEHLICCDPSDLKFIQDLHILLFTSKFAQIQEECAELIAETYTNFGQKYVQKGKVKLQEFMKKLVNRIDDFIFECSALENEDKRVELYGLICLVGEMLSATQIRGVGELKSHNSLITTSMIKIKVWNNASYGEDVQKCYEKYLPSNMTLFELLSIVGEKFKCNQQELYLQEGNNMAIPSKLNGHTLLELGLDTMKELNAYKNHKISITKQPLKVNGQLNPRFLIIIKQIFQMFSKDGKMGQKQIINYVQGVTNTSSYSKDSRVQIFLQEYDSLHNGYLTESDLIKFYEDSCDDGEKEKYIWSNLNNLHYRNDLRKFNEPIGPIEEANLFRFHIKNNEKLYDLLFMLCRSQSEKIAKASKKLLQRLPTCEALMSKNVQNIDFQDKDSFEISYILISVRYLLQKDQTNCQLSHQEQKEKSRQIQTENDSKFVQNTSNQSAYIKKFVENSNDQKVYSLIKEIAQKNPSSEAQKVLFIVSISILRVLINFPSLAEDYTKKQKYTIKDLNRLINQTRWLKFGVETRFFIKMVEKCLIQNQFAIFQSVLALSLIYKNLQWQNWMKIGIFHNETEVRKNTLNFLIFHSLKSNFQIDFFALDLRIESHHSEEWFSLLCFYIRFNPKANAEKYLQFIIMALQEQKEEVSSIGYFNQILNGNLNTLQTILTIHSELKVKRNEEIYSMLQKLIERTLSGDNRMIQYKLMASLNPAKLMDNLYSIVKSIKPTEKYQIKENYVGIKNLGSICYMNSILQQFFMIKQFQNLIVCYPTNQNILKTIVNDQEIIDDFMYQLQKMYTYLKLTNRKFYNPKQFCLTIKDSNKKPINTLIQEDAHEFLNNLFGQVENYMKQAHCLQKLEKLFQGKTICQITCKDCQTKKSKIQDFYHLALEVKDSANLKQSFQKFIAPEVIQGYHCERCNKKVDKITKQTFINVAPEILIINLQRIIFDLNTFQKVKLHSCLEFPQILDVKQFTHSDCQGQNKVYNLKGVVIHSGTSEGGHYFSLIKTGTEWYKFNDQTVSKSSLSDLQREAFGEQHTDSWGNYQFSTNAYILFYEADQNQTAVADQIKSQEPNNKIVENQVNNKSQQVPKDFSPRKLVQSSGNKQTNKKIEQQVLQQNKEFYRQLQIHQQSLFSFMNQFYVSVRPHQAFKDNPCIKFVDEWQKLTQHKTYNKIFLIYMQMLNFLVSFSQITPKTMQDLGTAIYELISLLPQQTYDLVHGGINYKFWAQVICTHHEIGVREVYKVVLTKIIFVYINYYEWVYQKIPFDLPSQRTQSMEPQIKMSQSKLEILDQHEKPTQFQQLAEHDRIQEILKYFLWIAETDLVSKNVFKSFFFFDFWNVCIQMDGGIQNFCLDNQYLLTLLDLLMGNEGPLASKDKKRQNFPYEITAPMVQSINRLLIRKKNLVGAIPFKSHILPEQNYLQLTDPQKKILSSKLFYCKMMKFKYDNGFLSQVIEFMSTNDKNFSAKVCRFFLEALNRLDLIDDAFILLNNIKAFLKISDSLQPERMKWLLGIAQFQQSCRDLNYGLKYSKESANIVYVSSRYFISDEQYKPALQVLHDKRNYFTDFEVQGIITLLEIINSSDQIVQYVINLPPPSYLYLNYFTWIDQYILRLQNWDSYNLSIDRKKASQSMRRLLNQILDKLQKIPKTEGPVLKKIIGKNKKLELDESLENEVFKINKWSHETYTLENLPQVGNTNSSLPDQIFGAEPKGYSKYFIENIKSQSSDAGLRTQKTVTTLQIQTSKPLKIIFSLPYFSHEIYFEIGKIFVNFLYINRPLQEFVDIQILENDQSIEKPEQEGGHKINKNLENGESKDSVFQGGFEGKIGGGYDDPNDRFEIICQSCTFINAIERTRCEMCDNPLSSHF